MKILALLIPLILIVQLTSCANSKKNTDSVQTDPFKLHPSAYQTDFVGYAVDSSWKISITYDNLVLLTKKDGSLHFRGTQINKKVIDKTNHIRLTATDESEMVEVVINPTICKGGGYNTDVIYSKAGLRSFEASGCGHQQGAIKLYDLWTLTSINQEKIDRSLFSKQPPFMVINLKDATLSGFGGCNNFNGKMNFDYNSFTIDAFMTTKKYCGDNSKIENKLFKILRSGKIHYIFKQNTVIFETSEGSVAFRKVD